LVEIPERSPDLPGDLAWIQSTEHWGNPTTRHGWSVSTEHSFEPPVPIHRVAPEMPDSLQEAGIKGTAIVVISIDRKGLVFDAKVAGSNLPAVLDSLAITAARLWRFKPGKTQGRAVNSSLSIPFKFPPPTGAR
jgi:TonB family protein